MDKRLLIAIAFCITHSSAGGSLHAMRLVWPGQAANMDDWMPDAAFGTVAGVNSTELLFVVTQASLPIPRGLSLHSQQHYPSLG